MKWTSVIDCLPSVNQDDFEVYCYLVTDGSWIGMAYYTPNQEWIFADATNAKAVVDWMSITHWMSLPELPVITSERATHRMKCPFRPIESYTKKQIVRKTRDLGGYNYFTEIVPCNKEEANWVNTDFADCILEQCPLYKDGNCSRLTPI